MSNSLGEAVLDLAADGSGLQRDIEKSKPAALAAMVAIGNVAGEMFMKAFQKALDLAIALPKLIWAAANTLDAAYDNIQTRTGATGAELEALKADFEAVFTSVPTDAQTASNAIAILNSTLGYSGPVLEGVTTKLLELSRITGTDAASNAQLYSQMIQNWDISMKTAGNSLDVLFVAAQKTGIPVEGLMQLMVSSGPILRQYGLSFNEAAAFMASLSQAGVDAESAMMGLKTAAAKFASEGMSLSKGLEYYITKIRDSEKSTLALNTAVNVFGGRAGPLLADAIRAGKLEFEDLLPLLQSVDGAIMDTAESTMDWGERLTMFKNQVTTQFAPAGQKLMDVAVKIMAAITATFERPDVQAAINKIAGWIGFMAEKSAAYIPLIVDAFFQFVSFLQNNEGAMVAVLSALGAAIVAFAVMVAPSIWAVTAPILAIIAIMALVAGVAYLVYQAWTNNWGGIQTKLTALWAQFQPIFMQLVNWLQVNIPLALAALSTYWTTVLLPAIQAVWLWIQTYLLPLFSAIGNLIGTVLTMAVKILAGLWVNVLWPALKKVIDWMETKLMPVLEPVANFFKEVFVKALEAVKKIIEGVTAAIRKLIEALNSIDLPSELTPGSPTPFEMGLRGIHKALSDINRISLPKFAAGLQFQPALSAMMGAGASSSVVSGDTYNINGIRMENAGPQTTLQQVRDYLNKRT